MNDRLDLAQSAKYIVLNEATCLFTGGNKLNHFLQSASTVLIESNLNHLWCCVVNQYSALIIVRKLKQLLT